MIAGGVEDRSGRNALRLRFRLRRDSVAVLMVFSAFLVYSSRCVVTCWGSEGQFTYAQSPPLNNLGIG